MCYFDCVRRGWQNAEKLVEKCGPMRISRKNSELTGAIKMMKNVAVDMLANKWREKKTPLGQWLHVKMCKFSRLALDECFVASTTHSLGGWFECGSRNRAVIMPVQRFGQCCTKMKKSDWHRHKKRTLCGRRRTHITVYPIVSDKRSDTKTTHRTSIQNVIISTLWLRRRFSAAKKFSFVVPGSFFQI